MNKPLTMLAALSAFAASTPALAQSASSSAYGLSVNETATVPGLATVTATVAPVAPASGSAPPSYNNSNQVASVTESAALGGVVPLNQNLSTGLITSTAAGTPTSATATSTINNLSAGLTGLFDANVLSIGATTITSTSQASSAGGLTTSGSSFIEGLRITGTLLGSLGIDVNALVSAAPNTTFSVAGLSLIFNQQSMLGDGINSIGTATNAIQLNFNNFAAGTRLLNGTINIGHSEAFVTSAAVAAVPEPSTWALMLIGFGAVGLAMRRKPSRTLQLKTA
ncbi:MULTISPECIES: PEPxxWA-CTERM sorting domain-containing protein [Sphingomonas]|uniref:PEPxxWA-CTERM sorting domain-containing protein n=1 Tax=Sphingomonas TaxID=13687 RepID=UPI001269AE62|nr:MULTISPECIES: PEPxxWA-CTERM sorting domain-containing protein [Sphingomonas]